MPLTPAEKQAAYRARRRQEQLEELSGVVTADYVLPDTVVPHLEEELVEHADLTVPDLCIKARAGELELSEADEQRIRDFWGYLPSERRTLAERDTVTQRILAG